VKSFPDNIIRFQKKHRLLSHAAYWFVVLLIAVSSSKYSDGKRATYSFEFLTDFLYELPEIAAAYILTYVIVPQFFYKKNYFIAVLTFIVSSYATCVAARIIIVKICEPLAGIAPKAFESYSEISTDMLKLLYVYFFQIFSVAFVFMCLKVLKDQLEIQKRSLTLEKEKAETELKLLKTQLNPHFLFNTLNNIYSLSFTSSPVTSESIARLADILDHILYRCDTPYVPLASEIALIKNYIELEKLRYDKRLTVNFDMKIEHEIAIAPLILLSLIENAFKHGAADDTGAPKIDIDLEVNAQHFIFTISNTIATQKGDIQNSSANGIGLNNLRKQLDLIYGDDYKLTVCGSNNFFEVSLSIKLKHQTAYEENKMLVG